MLHLTETRCRLAVFCFWQLGRQPFSLLKCTVLIRNWKSCPVQESFLPSRFWTQPRSLNAICLLLKTHLLYKKPQERKYSYMIIGAIDQLTQAKTRTSCQSFNDGLTWIASRDKNYGNASYWLRLKMNHSTKPNVLYSHACKVHR